MAQPSVCGTASDLPPPPADLPPPADQANPPPNLPPNEEQLAPQASMPRWTLPVDYVPRGLPPAPELQWDGDEPYLPLPDGYRITPYRATEADYAAVVSEPAPSDHALWSLQAQAPATVVLGKQ